MFTVNELVTTWQLSSDGNFKVPDLHHLEGNSMRHEVSNYDNYESKPLLVITMDLYDTVALHRGRRDNYVQL